MRPKDRQKININHRDIGSVPPKKPCSNTALGNYLHMYEFTSDLITEVYIVSNINHGKTFLRCYTYSNLSQLS